MARERGVASFSGSFEPQRASPIDARSIVGTKNDLIDANTWLANDGISYAYTGLSVVVHGDPNPDNNGLYILKALPTTDINNWEKYISGIDPYSKETASRTVYISSTGSDATGDGTLALPYFSLHRAVDSLNTIIDAAIIIQASEGTYDFTSLGTLYLNRFLITTSGSITIRNNTTVLLSTNVQTSGTFTNHSLLQKGPSSTDLSSHGVVHNQSGATFTPSAYEGMILYVTSMQNGHALPNAAYRYLPIMDNGADWVETAPIYSSTSVTTQQYQDIANYQILDYKVKFNFGGNKIVWPLSAGLISFTAVSISNVGSLSIASLEGNLDSNKSPRFVNSKLTFLSGANNKDYSGSVLYQWSYINFGVSTGNLISTIQGCAIKSSATGTGNTTPLSIGGTFTGNNLLCTNATKPEYAMLLPGKFGLGNSARVGLRDTNKVIGTSKGVFTKNATATFFNCGGKWIIDSSCQFFLQLSQQNRQTLLAGIFDTLFPIEFLPAEPTVGRVTYDGLTEITSYFSLDSGYNLLSIAPLAKQFNPDDVITGSYSDTVFTLYDNITPTKKINFQLSDLTAGTTRTITCPDRNLDLNVPIFLGASLRPVTAPNPVFDFPSNNSYRFIGDGTNDTATLFDAILTLGANGDTYKQINIFNASNGSGASSDYVATANNGSDTTHYINMGINSGSFSAGGGGMGGGANVGYLLCKDDELHVFTGAAQSLRLGVNNTEHLTIGSTGFVGIGISAPTDYLQVELPTGVSTLNKGITVTRGTGFFRLGNGTTSADYFVPTVWGKSSQPTLATALGFVGQAGSDSDTTLPIIHFSARNVAGTGAIGATQQAFEFTNNTTSILKMFGNGNIAINRTTASAKLHVEATASGVNEVIQRWSVSDDAGGYLEARNGLASTSASRFNPCLYGLSSNLSDPCLTIWGGLPGQTGTAPIVLIKGDYNGAASTTRPPFAVNNHTTRLATYWPDGVLEITGSTLRISTQSTPSSATATGVKGDVVHDTNYIYICTATNTWKRATLATW